MKKLYFLLLLPLTALFWGCNIINPHEKTPVYVHIDSVQFVPNQARMPGTTSEKITSVYAYFNNTTIGVFTLPATIPVLTDTPGVFKILPAVPYDGINGEQESYPFFTFDTIGIQPLPAHVFQFNPKASYGTGLGHLLDNDFEDSSATTSYVDAAGGIGDVTFENTPGQVFEGAHSGAIYLDSSTAMSDVVSAQGTGTSLQSATEAYIEINYKCNTSFAVGLYSVPTNSTSASSVSTYIVTFVAHPDGWNKAYIDLKSVLTTYGSAYSQHILIHAQPDAGLNSAYVLLDNIRIVYY